MLEKWGVGSENSENPTTPRYSPLKEHEKGRRKFRLNGGGRKGGDSTR